LRELNPDLICTSGLPRRHRYRTKNKRPEKAFCALRVPRLAARQTA